MSEEIYYCDSCKASIMEGDFETGSAVTLLGKRYCARCKGAAIRKVSLDEVMAGPAAAGKRPAPSAPAPPKPRPPTRAPEAKPAPPARRVPLPRRSPRRPPILLAAAGGGALLLAILLALAFRGKPEPPPPSKANTPAVPAPGTSPESREAAAEKACATAGRVSSSTSNPDEALKAIEAARPACRGTPWETKLDELKAKALKQKEDASAEQDLRRLLDEIKAMIAQDPAHAQYEAVMAKVQQARGLAARVAPTSVPEIQQMVSPYSERYEKMAEPHYAEIVEVANGLTRERRYDDAIKKIETFPKPLRQSQAWKNLEGLKRQIELQKKDDPSGRGR